MVLFELKISFLVVELPQTLQSRRKNIDCFRNGDLFHIFQSDGHMLDVYVSFLGIFAKLRMCFKAIKKDFNNTFVPRPLWYLVLIIFLLLIILEHDIISVNELAIKFVPVSEVVNSFELIDSSRRRKFFPVGEIRDPLNSSTKLWSSHIILS